MNISKRIQSFSVNHDLLEKGLYLSRIDGNTRTYDLRLKKPNAGDYFTLEQAHTIEHLAATFLRNHPVWGPKIVYWGPMGCCTGNYLLVQGDLESRDIVPLMQETFKFIAEYDGDIPGATARDCGNYILHNLPMAKWEARKYLIEVLNNLTEANLNYPTD